MSEAALEWGGKYGQVALVAAVTGGDVLPSQSPFIPCGVEAIVAEAVAAAEAGATCVHLHARTDDGRPTGSAAMFAEIAAGIRARSDVVLCASTGGAVGMSVQERLEGTVACAPEIATLNLGTLNFEGFPTPARWPEAHHEWERQVLEQSGRVVFENTLATIREIAGRLGELGITPELEAYDIGHLAMARFLIDEGTLKPPVKVQLVLGILGGVGGSLSDLVALKEAAHRVLGPDLASLGVACAGYPGQFRAAAAALGDGLDCRVGLEDNLRVERGAKARGNAELVGVAVQLAALLGRPIAAPDSLRRFLAERHVPDLSGTSDR